MSVLWNCPFCNGEASFGSIDYSTKTVNENGWSQKKFYYVNCIRCGSDNKGLVGHTSETKAARHWNTRVKK